MTRKKQVNWTEKQMQTIYKMRMSGSSINSIAAVFPKRKFDAVKAKITRMGFSVVDGGEN
jgi:hypothetical protein